jgi:hypothetical protein
VQLDLAVADEIERHLLESGLTLFFSFADGRLHSR